MMLVTRSRFRLLATSALLLGTFHLAVAAAQVEQPDITPDEARAIARDAYIYGYPMVDAYRVHYSYFVDRDDPEFKAPWNQLRNTPRVYTPEDNLCRGYSLD